MALLEQVVLEVVALEQLVMQVVHQVLQTQVEVAVVTEPIVALVQVVLAVQVLLS